MIFEGKMTFILATLKQLTRSFDILGFVDTVSEPAIGLRNTHAGLCRHTDLGIAKFCWLGPVSSVIWASDLCIQND